MKLLILMCLASAVTASRFSNQLDSKWEQHKSNVHKQYSPEEEGVRKAYFIEAERSIQRQNRRPLGYKAAHNKFSDMSPDEKKKYLGLGARKKDFRNRNWSSQIQNRTFGFFPSSVQLDYRQDNCLQPMKDQLDCGSCWAFTAVTPLEFSKCKLTGTPVALSEQHLVDCDTSNNGCSGGWYDDAWEFMKDGAILEDKYRPYSAAENTCSANSAFIGAKVLSYEWVEPTTEAMIEALKDGPLAVAMMVVDSFFHYRSGVYSSLECGSTVNHAVVIVGYGVSNGTPYWIMRNSWGKDWGNGGYMLIRMGNNMCNIEQYAAKVKAKVT